MICYKNGAIGVCRGGALLSAGRGGGSRRYGRHIRDARGIEGFGRAVEEIEALSLRLDADTLRQWRPLLLSGLNPRCSGAELAKVSEQLAQLCAGEGAGDEGGAISVMFRAGLVERLASWMQQQEVDDLRVNAAAAMAGVASGSAAWGEALVNAVGLVLFVELLREAAPVPLQIQLLLVLGTLAASGDGLRDRVVNEGGFAAMVSILERCDSQPPKMVQSAAWAVRCCFQGASEAPEQALAALPLLARMLVTRRDAATLVELCVAITNAADKSGEECLTPVVQEAALKPLIGMIRVKGTVQKAALEVLGMLTAGSNDDSSRAALDAGLLDGIMELLSDPSTSPRVRKEALWTLSNVAAEECDHKQYILDQPGLLKWVVDCMQREPIRICREAAWTIRNLLEDAKLDQAQQFIVAGGPGALAIVLRRFGSNASVLEVVNDAVLCIIKHAEDWARQQENSLEQERPEWASHLSPLLDWPLPRSLRPKESDGKAKSAEATQIVATLERLRHLFDRPAPGANNA